MNFGDGQSWLGEIGTSSPLIAGVVTGIFGFSEENIFCIIQQGVIFLINATDPATYREIDSDGGIVWMHFEEKENILLLGSQWTITGVGPDGFIWRTPRLSIDGFKVSGISGWNILGTSDPESDGSHEFSVDLRSGVTVGKFIGIL
ncbi:hypothetical protein [Psychromicrobium sp. YIM B11713]|uniref:hypothetical protein n=1 Tax=Psychromicrobium sp. YIM B11713 TaxID=3145233 RepID=UPI00374EC492